MPTDAVSVNIGDVNAEEAQAHGRQIEQRNPAGGGDHTHLEILGRLHQAGGISDKHRQESSNGQAHGLDGESRVAGLECRRERPEHKPFE